MTSSKGQLRHAPRTVAVRGRQSPVWGSPCWRRLWRFRWRGRCPGWAAAARMRAGRARQGTPPAGTPGRHARRGRTASEAPVSPGWPLQTPAACPVPGGIALQLRCAHATKATMRQGTWEAPVSIHGTTKNTCCVRDETGCLGCLMWDPGNMHSRLSHEVQLSARKLTH